MKYCTCAKNLPPPSRKLAADCRRSLHCGRDDKIFVRGHYLLGRKERYPKGHTPQHCHPERSRRISLKYCTCAGNLPLPTPKLAAKFKRSLHCGRDDKIFGRGHYLLGRKERYQKGRTPPNTVILSEAEGSTISAINLPAKPCRTLCDQSGPAYKFVLFRLRERPV